MSTPGQRDRDGDGRARNARPRDGLGRPLPHGAIGVERAPEGVRRSPAEAVHAAQALLDAGRPFHAHEVFEDAWKSTPGPDRELWRGLAQLAVGLTHAARGNRRGAGALLRRGAEVLGPFAGNPGVDFLDVPSVLRWAEAAVADADAGREPPPLRLDRPGSGAQTPDSGVATPQPSANR